jgi:hypothetical protein
MLVIGDRRRSLAKSFSSSGINGVQTGALHACEGRCHQANLRRSATRSV